MEQEAVTGYPLVGVRMHVNPKASERAWGASNRLRAFQEFFHEQDHVKKLAEYFNRLLDEVEEFRKRYPKVPWTAQQAAEEEE